MSRRDHVFFHSGCLLLWGCALSRSQEERQKLLSEHFGYTNTSNPFGDRMLAEPFVWKKKNQLLQAAGQKHKTTISALMQSSKNKVVRREGTQSVSVLLVDFLFAVLRKVFSRVFDARASL